MARKQDQQWHSMFDEYTRFIAFHPAYAGMPDAIREDGTIQWEAPSNRKGGKYKDSHLKRLDWWRAKAIEVGIDPTSNEWISKTAKTIHPTGKKPCRRCGKVMEIAYAYPNRHLLRRIEKLPYVTSEFVLDPLEHITDLVPRMAEEYGERIFSDLPKLLHTNKISPPDLEPQLEAWLLWISSEYIPSEPGTLSPGAMANPPDRFDGFHHFNLCCRGNADSGRHDSNLRSYTTDRRAFEYWVGGDWIAADRLMGAVKTNLGSENCMYGHPGPCTADHIGPISLGFTHRPEFQLLCKTCNSSKNNRMTLSDVIHLKKVEADGVTVASWYSEKLWNLRKSSVNSQETAHRLSKMLRDNRNTAMQLLSQMRVAGYMTFLIDYLELSHADYEVEFVNLRVVENRTSYDEIRHVCRTTKYAIEQKARRIRIAFEALGDYASKEKRNALEVSSTSIEALVIEAMVILDQQPQHIHNLDREIEKLATLETKRAEQGLRSVAEQLPLENPPEFEAAHNCLVKAMNQVADEISGMWNQDRYVRSEFETMDG